VWSETPPYKQSQLTTMPQQSRRLFFEGARDTLPLIIAAIPFGMVFGALAQTNGLSVGATLSMSALVYAGSSQFIAATLAGTAASLPVIIVTVFIVNLRHMLYATSLMPHVTQLPQHQRAIMAFWLTDETFATISHHLQTHTKPGELLYYYLGSATAMYLNWQACTAVGVFLQQRIPDMTSWGLDIAMVVAFTGIVVPLLRDKSQWACAGVASVTALFTHDWPHQSGLLFSSLLAIAVGVALSPRGGHV